jgi:hypothetical protein
MGMRSYPAKIDDRAIIYYQVNLIHNDYDNNNNNNKYKYPINKIFSC